MSVTMKSLGIVQLDDRANSVLLEEPEASRQFSLHVRSGQIRERTGERSPVKIGGAARVAGLCITAGSADTVECRLGIAADHFEQRRNSLLE
jgi:hypothetical protein